MPSRRSAALLGCALLFAAAPGLAAPAGGAPKPAAKAAAGELPPGVKLQAQPSIAKPKPVKKTAGKASRKKKQASKARGTLKSGRAAVTTTPLDFVDKNQLATDHLADVKNKSPLDLLASYKETVRDGDLETAAVLLRLAASGTPTHETVTSVNDLLGISLNTEDTEILVGLASGGRASAYDQGAAAEPATVAVPSGNRIDAAHSAAESAPKGSRLDALAAYKEAVTQARPDAAALALTGVMRRKLDAEAVDKANILLGVTGVMPDSSILAKAPAAL